MSPFNLYGIFRMIFKNPMTLFVYGIMTKWYIIVLVPAVVVVFWVFKGLSDIGVISYAENITTQVLEKSQAIAKHCIPKISNRTAFLSCIDNPPKYKASDDEKKLKQDLDRYLRVKKAKDKKPKFNPYDDKE